MTSSSAARSSRTAAEPTWRHPLMTEAAGGNGSNEEAERIATKANGRVEDLQNTVCVVTWASDFEVDRFLPRLTELSLLTVVSVSDPFYFHCSGARVIGKPLASVRLLRSAAHTAGLPRQPTT